MKSFKFASCQVGTRKTSSGRCNLDFEVAVSAVGSTITTTIVFIKASRISRLLQGFTLSLHFREPVEIYLSS
jgi:hypothetical protein